MFFIRNLDNTYTPTVMSVIRIALMETFGEDYLDDRFRTAFQDSGIEGIGSVIEAADDSRWQHLAIPKHAAHQLEIMNAKLRIANRIFAFRKILNPIKLCVELPLALVDHLSDRATVAKLTSDELYNQKIKLPRKVARFVQRCLISFPRHYSRFITAPVNTLIRPYKSLWRRDKLAVVLMTLVVAATAVIVGGTVALNGLNELPFSATATEQISALAMLMGLSSQTHIGILAGALSGFLMLTLTSLFTSNAMRYDINGTRCQLVTASQPEVSDYMPGNRPYQEALVAQRALSAASWDNVDMDAWVLEPQEITCFVAALSTIGWTLYPHQDENNPRRTEIVQLAGTQSNTAETTARASV